MSSCTNSPGRHHVFAAEAGGEAAMGDIWRLHGVVRFGAMLAWPHQHTGDP